MYSVFVCQTYASFVFECETISSHCVCVCVYGHLSVFLFPSPDVYKYSFIAY